MTPDDRTGLPNSPPSVELAKGSRRRLLRGGLAATPALLTLVSRPVMAATCQTASSHLSASLSRPSSGVFNCVGKKPASWFGTAAASWPTGSRAQLFSVAVGSSASYGTKTLLEMVALSSDMGAEGLAKHLAAAYVNAVQGLVPPEVLSVPTIRNIWASFISRGYYEPTAGIMWYPDSAVPANPRGGLIAWLKTTMPN